MKDGIYVGKPGQQIKCSICLIRDQHSFTISSIKMLLQCVSPRQQMNHLVHCMNTSSKTCEDIVAKSEGWIYPASSTSAVGGELSSSSSSFSFSSSFPVFSSTVLGIDGSNSKYTVLDNVICNSAVAFGLSD